MPTFIKYCFYILLSALFMNCGDGSRRTYTPPYTPGQNLNRNLPGHCYYAQMNGIESKNYELLLAEAPQPFCGKTGGTWLVNKQIYLLDSACKNWTGIPVIQISFDLQFKKIQKFQINPRHNKGRLAPPVVFFANAMITPQNEDKGWGARIPPATYNGGIIDFYCPNCDFKENKDMTIRLEYRDRPIGSFKINPKQKIARCQSTANPHAYPR